MRDGNRQRKARGEGAGRQGDYRRAITLFSDSLELSLQEGDKLPIAESLEGLAHVAARTAHPYDAVRCYAAGKVLRLASGTVPPPHERVAQDDVLRAARAELGDQAFTAAWDQATAKQPEEVLRTCGGLRVHARPRTFSG